MPPSAAILWRPAEGLAGAEAPAFPIFVSQRVLTAVHGHVRSEPDDGVLGFLLGQLFQSPATAVPYLLVDSTIWISAPLDNDGTAHAVARRWIAVQREIRKGGGQILGWYHSHPSDPAFGVALSDGDVETHLRYFPLPWQTALVIQADGDAVEGGFFQPAAGPSWPSTFLPFYEALPDGWVPAGGGSPKPTVLAWRNYHTADATVEHAPQPDSGRAAQVSPPSIVFPEGGFKRAGQRRHVRAGLVALGLALVAGLLGLWYLISRDAPPPAPAVAVGGPPSAATPLAEAGVALERALRAYNARARLFDDRQMDCADLAQGFLAVDGQWVAYGVALRAAGDAVAPPPLASGLFEQVTAAERHFDDSGCERP